MASSHTTSTTVLEFIKTDIMPPLLKHSSLKPVEKAIEQSKQSNPVSFFSNVYTVITLYLS